MLLAKGRSTNLTEDGGEVKGPAEAHPNQVKRASPTSTSQRTPAQELGQQGTRENHCGARPTISRISTQTRPTPAPTGPDPVPLGGGSPSGQAFPMWIANGQTWEGDGSNPFSPTSGRRPLTLCVFQETATEPPWQNTPLNSTTF